MKKFIKDICLFSAPILLFIAFLIFLYFVGYQSGELREINDSITAQRENHSILLGMGYNEQTLYYKLTNANYYKAELIALGTSRAMQFKSNYFKKNFYNCGGAVGGNYNEYRNFLENLTYIPEFILLDLDAWVFNDAWNKNCLEYDDYVEIIQADRSENSILKTMTSDYISGKWKLSDLRCYSKNIGFNGKIKDEGFLYDGSYYYGSVYRHPEQQEDYKFVNTKERIVKGISRFEYGENIDNDTIKQLKNLLDYCSEKGIYVVGYIAPYAPSIYADMTKSIVVS